MEVTIKCRPDGVLMMAGDEWVTIPESNVPHFAAMATIKKNVSDSILVLDYSGVEPEYQYEQVWIEHQVPHRRWVTVSRAEFCRKPFFLKKRVIFPELVEAN